MARLKCPLFGQSCGGMGGFFYNAFGHHADAFDEPAALEIIRLCFLWTAEGKVIALREGLDSKAFKNEAKMF